MNTDEILKVADEPAVWMQSTHLSQFEHHSCGSDSMLARCSDRQLQKDYRPLYTETNLLAVAEAMYAKGQEDMRERAWRAAEDQDTGVTAAWVIRELDLPITPTNTEGEQG